MTVAFRRAAAGDVPAIVALLADDVLGAARERVDDLGPYLAAFAAVDADPNQLLVVGESATDGSVVATVQVSFVPSLTRGGSWRAQLEGVRVASSERGSGVGRALVAWCLERAAERGCRLVQLTTDKRRPEALRFYESLGFVATHEGLKLDLPT